MYTVGLSLGVKFTAKGLYLSDLIDHLIDEFPLEVLEKGESIAIMEYNWHDMNHRFHIFRNALVKVALEEPLCPQPRININIRDS